ncbi:MAG: OmpA family protein [Mediterranea sp.]|jgi:outer membrane protein OmpA-like peptidoglycan-associated protein|nr:OmpA family protein [Mediterranea sp.]
MKRILVILFLFTIVGTTTGFAKTSDSLRVTNIQLRLQGDSLHIAFDLHISKKVVKRGDAWLLTPSLTNAGNKLSLTPLLLEHEKIASVEPFRQTVSHQPWMRGGDLLLNALIYDCCEVTDIPLGVIAPNILTQTPIRSQTTPAAPVVAVPPKQEPPIAEAPSQPPYPSSYNREAEMPSYPIQFRQGETVPDEYYGNNREALNKLTEELIQSENSDDSRISYIFIDGHVSPEGGLEANRSLGYQRALSVKRYLEKRTGISGERIVAHDGYIDWNYLRSMVLDSNMHEKNEVVHIIDNVPEWDASRKVGRLGQLMLLHGGNTYRYMLNNFFPKMRNATYIRVFYKTQF